MNNTRIIPQLEKNYIDTLYLTCDLSDFHTSVTDCNASYRSLHEYYLSSMAIDPNFLWEYFPQKNLTDLLKPIIDKNGYQWFKTPNYRLGLLIPEKYHNAKKLNWSTVIIQYDHTHIFSLNLQLKGLDLPFTSDRSLYKIKRIDVTKTIKHDVDLTKNHGYLTRTHDDPFNPTRHINTVYLGNRSNGKVFRLYPKTVELLETKNSHKTELYAQFFGDIENLYTFELELNRKYLTKYLGISILSDLPKLIPASQNIISQIRIVENTPRNRYLHSQKHGNRIKALVLTDYVDYERPLRKTYIPSKTYAQQKMLTVQNNYFDSMNIPKTTSLLLQFTLETLSQYMDINGQEITLSLSDSVHNDELQQMHKKHSRLKYGETPDLDLASHNAFSLLQVERLCS